MSATTLQLAQLYAIIANGGKRIPLTIQRREGVPEGRQVLSKESADAVLAMLESVVANGSGRRAQVRGYRVAGKTGTTRKAIAGGYGDEYVALFAGVMPASNPHFAMAVMINEPAGDKYHGGSVAAPVFSSVAEQAARILNLTPDNIEERTIRVAGFSGGAQQ